MDAFERRVRQHVELHGGRARVLYSDLLTLAAALQGADVVIGAVLVPGALAPKVVRREDLKLMRTEVVRVDVAIDQGAAARHPGRPHYDEPTFSVDGRAHNCMANMPGGVPCTATRALTNATLPFVLRLASQGFEATVGACSACERRQH